MDILNPKASSSFRHLTRNSPLPLSDPTSPEQQENSNSTKNMSKFIPTAANADITTRPKSPLLQKNDQQPMDRFGLIRNVNKNSVHNDTENNEKNVCYNCKNMFADDHYHNHLLFGDIMCGICTIKFTDCDSFQRYSTNVHFQSLCQHQYEFTLKSFQYLFEEISGVLSKEGSGHQVGPQIMQHLVIYVNYLRSLNTIAPWSVAIANCLEFLEDDELGDDLSVTREIKVEKDTEVDVDSSRGAENRAVVEETLPKDRRRMEENETIAEETLPRDQWGEDSVPDDCGEVLLEESYSLATLEGTIECHIAGDCQERLSFDRNSPMGSPQSSSSYSNEPFSKSCPKECLESSSFKEHAHASFPRSSSSKGKPLSKKGKLMEHNKPRQKKGCETTPKPITPQLLYESMRTMIQDLVQTPSDDFYYIADGPIEHCPNCSSLLSPTWTSVNITTLLVTSICPECDLTIYIIPNLPDLAAKIKVLTQKGQTKGKGQNKKSGDKIKYKIIPKSEVRNLVGDTEPHKLHPCIHRTLRNRKNKI